MRQLWARQCNATKEEVDSHGAIWEANNYSSSRELVVKDLSQYFMVALLKLIQAKIYNFTS